MVNKEKGQKPVYLIPLSIFGEYKSKPIIILSSNEVVYTGKFNNENLPMIES